MIELVYLALLIGSATVVAVIAAGRWLLDSRYDPDDEDFVEQLRGTQVAELLGGRVEDPTEGSGLATEADALLWGFQADWMAVERLELCRTWWRERA